MNVTKRQYEMVPSCLEELVKHRITCLCSQFYQSLYQLDHRHWCIHPHNRHHSQDLKSSLGAIP